MVGAAVGICCCMITVQRRSVLDHPPFPRLFVESDVRYDMWEYIINKGERSGADMAFAS